VLGPVLALSFGLGLIFVSTTIVAVAGVSPRESGLSSALLNVGQQLGGSLGLAVLGTVAATVSRNELANRVPPTHALINQAVTAGYRSAFAISAAIALVGFLIAVAVIKGRPQRDEITPVPEVA
jgi:sugar phosphate permease